SFSHPTPPASMIEVKARIQASPRLPEAKAEGRRRRPEPNSCGCSVATSYSLLFLFFLLLVLFVFLVFHPGQFQRLNPHNFEIGAALRAGDNFALVNFLFFNIQIAFAFRTHNHDDCLRFLSGATSRNRSAPPLHLYLESPGTSVK